MTTPSSSSIPAGADSTFTWEFHTVRDLEDTFLNCVLKGDVFAHDPRRRVVQPFRLGEQNNSDEARLKAGTKVDKIVYFNDRLSALYIDGVKYSVW